MKTKIAKIAGALVIALGLTSAVASAENEGAPHAADFSKIVLGSEGGFTGKGTGIGLRVEADGNLVATNGDKQKNGKLKPEELATLNKLVAAVDWDKVERRYDDPIHSDRFYSVLTVTIGEKVGVTSVIETRPDKVPKSLISLIDFLNELHGSYQP